MFGQAMARWWFQTGIKWQITFSQSTLTSWGITYRNVQVRPSTFGPAQEEGKCAPKDLLVAAGQNEGFRGAKRAVFKWYLDKESVLLRENR